MKEQIKNLKNWLWERGAQPRVLSKTPYVFQIAYDLEKHGVHLKDCPYLTDECSIDYIDSLRIYILRTNLSPVVEFNCKTPSGIYNWCRQNNRGYIQTLVKNTSARATTGAKNKQIYPKALVWAIKLFGLKVILKDDNFMCINEDNDILYVFTPSKYIPVALQRAIATKDKDFIHHYLYTAYLRRIETAALDEILEQKGLSVKTRWDFIESSSSVMTF